jgi:hypothetical protein
MAAGQIEILGDDVFCSTVGGDKEARFPLIDATPRLQGLAQRYDKASERDDEGELAAIGREMFGAFGKCVSPVEEDSIQRVVD